MRVSCTFTLLYVFFSSFAYGTTPALDRIGVRENPIGSDRYEFYKVNSGTTFIPIGYTYFIEDEWTTAPPDPLYNWVNFEQAFSDGETEFVVTYDPDSFCAQTVSSEIQAMKNAGYSVVRFFVDGFFGWGKI